MVELVHRHSFSVESRLSKKLVNLPLFHVMRGGSNATPSATEIGKMFLLVNTQNNKCEARHESMQYSLLCRVWGNQYSHVAGV